MKKLKRFLAGVLTFAMAMSLMTMTAFADETKMPTIDTTKTGSLTIHKYEYNGSEESEGTGSDTDAVPDGATPLPGVTFKITKVAELDTYYGTDGIALPSVVEAKASIDAGDYTVETTTDAQGEAVFSGLALGLYLVQETDAPAQITGKTEDFLVSIPMTNATEDDWLYDVHVFPKNSSTYASVTLKKTGKIGDDTATALAGATFVLQRKNGNVWETVTKNNKNVAIGLDDGTLTTASDGKITVSDLAPGTYRFVETGVPDDTGYIMDGSTVQEFTIAGSAGTDNSSHNHDAGDVLIDGKVVDTTQNPIAVVNYKPDVEKEVQNREYGATSWDNDADYSAGDVVPYKIKIDVPLNVGKLVDFTLSDTMTNQTYKSGTLKIYSDGNLETEILESDYIVTSQGNNDWSISFNTANNVGAADQTITSSLANYAGESIYIYFEATLDENAVVTSVGNPNTVKLEYSNEILPTEDDGNPNTPEEPSKDVITDQATVYTFKIAVLKKDGSNNTKLAGVKFDLYRKLNTNEMLTDENKKVTDPVSGLTGEYEKVKIGLTTDSNGGIEVKGLENGEYYLVETQTQNGYNLLKAPVRVDIAVSYETTTSTTTNTDVNGITTTTTTVSNTTFTGGDSGDAGTYTTEIKNNKGFTLPTTGGMGTYVFVFVGVSMMAAAVILFITTKKKETSKAVK